jgi:iron(III) transport system substrate-binding protein
VLIAGAPHPETGKKLIDYLLSKDTERKLALSDAAQIPLHQGVAPPTQLRPIESVKVMDVNYAEVAAKLRAIQPFLKEWVAGE